MRKDALQELSTRSINLEQFQWWAFRIKVFKSGKARFDIENVPKLFIDAFSETQTVEDNSQYKLVLYYDDTIDYVKHVDISGERIENKAYERTVVEIFGRKID